MKKTVLVCSPDNQFVSLVSSACQACALNLVVVKNGREIPGILDSSNIYILMLDATLHQPCVIDIFYLLVQYECKIPVIVIGDCQEKVLFSINRIGSSKNLSLFTATLSAFDSAELKNIIDLNDKKNLIINDEAITTALEKKQFKLHYQPKIDAVTNQLAGLEALIRWERPNHGLVFPDDFIPIAEESGLIIPMSYWVIGEAFKQYAAWKKKKINVKIAINLSAKILTDTNLPIELLRLLSVYKVNPQDICFEITETTAMHSTDIVLEVLTRIRLKGFALSIDDFGTGYSSLVELQRMPFTELKIDKSFVMDLASNKANMHIVHSTIVLARNMELSIVAEGVEDKETFIKLKELGCDSLQGYFIAKPLSNDAFIEWYQTHFDTNGAFIY